MGRRRTREAVKVKQDRRGVGDRLLRAGAELFADRGVQATQVADIARAAGLSVGGFYRYFRDKDELYRELLGRRFEAYLEELRGLSRGLVADSLLERFVVLRDVIRRTLQMHVEDPHTFLLWYRHDAGVSEQTSEVVEAFVRDVEALLVDALDRSITVGGSLDDATRRLVAASMLGMINTAAHRLIAQGESDVTQTAEVCTRMAAGALLALAPAEWRAPLLALYEQELGRAGHEPVLRR
jgi:AcrR family transcriptional regulator